MATRTRSRGSLVKYTTSGTCQVAGVFKEPKYPFYIRTPGTYNINHNISHMGSDDSETITDESNGFGKVNNCSHTKYDFDGGAPLTKTYKWKDVVNGGTATSTATSAGNRNNFYGTSYRGHLSTSNGLSVAAARRPGFGPELMSGLNSIYELKDLASMLRKIPVHLLWAAYRGKLNARTAKHANKWLSEFSDTLKARPLDALKGLVGLDLAWKFGVRPFLKDVNTVHSMLGSIDKKLQQLAEKPFTVAGRHQQEVSQVTVLGNGTDGATVSYFSSKTTLQRTTTRIDIVGETKKLAPNAFDKIDMMRIAALREFLGLSLDATDIWEALPYSFVVDWFIPIQTFIEQFKDVSPSSSWFVDVDRWTSTKLMTKGAITCMRTPIQTATTICENPDPLVEVVRFTTTTYTRTRSTTYTPLPVWIPSFRVPSLGQWWTGLELAVQRISTSR